jgi:hypothetical protein
MSENIPITFKAEPDALFLAMSEEALRQRAEIERLRARVEVLERVREAAQRTQECWGILFAFPLIDKPFEALRAALKDAKP